MRYTSEAIAEGAAVGTDFAATWTPIVTGVFDDNGTAYDAKIVATVSDGTTTTTTVTYANFVDGVIDGSHFPAANSGETVTYKVGYQYDNVKIPQNDLPIVNVEMANLPLIAKARRVAIYYSQIAAYQASTDYGFDMGKDLAQKAVAELAFEIDEEIIHFLADLGRKDGNYLEELEFNKTVPTGVSKRDHYESFIENIESAKVAIYNRTQKFMPSYMLAASDILPILAFIPGFKGASLSNIAGPFMAGTVQGLKVFVSPSLGQGEWFLGINGNDLSTSAAVYAPYMPIVPTQLVGYADGGMSQGFSTMYDLKALNEQLVVGSKIVKKPQPIDVNVNK